MIKPGFESLIRTALSLEKKPAVIIFESLGTFLCFFCYIMFICVCVIYFFQPFCVQTFL